MKPSRLAPLRRGRLRARRARTVSRAPAPDLGALAAAKHALAVDVGNHVAIAAEQRLGRAHLGARGQLALGEAVAAVLAELGFAAVGLGAAVAERALVHLATQAEGAG